MNIKLDYWRNNDNFIFNKWYCTVKKNCLKEKSSFFCKKYRLCNLYRKKSIFVSEKNCLKEKKNSFSVKNIDSVIVTEKNPYLFTEKNV